MLLPIKILKTLSIRHDVIWNSENFKFWGGGEGIAFEKKKIITETQINSYILTSTIVELSASIPKTASGF